MIKKQFLSLMLLSSITFSLPLHSQWLSEAAYDLIIGTLKGISHACLFLKAPQMLHVSDGRPNFPSLTNLSFPLAGLLWGTTGSFFPTNNDQRFSYVLASLGTMAVIIYGFNNGSLRL